MSRRGVLLGCVLGLTAAVVLGAYALRVVSGEFVDFDDGSLPYYIVADKTVRGFPRIAPTAEGVRFEYTAGDGSAPDHLVMTYLSTATGEELGAQHRAHCLAQGYDALPGEDLVPPIALGCQTPDQGIRVFIEPSEAGRLVIVEFEGW